MSIEENKAIVARFQEEVLNGRRLDLVDDVIHPDYVLNNGLVKGREVARQGFAEMMANPESHYKIIDVIGEGDKVVTRWEATEGGKRWKGLSIFRIEDGKIKDDFYCTEEI